MRNNFIVYMYLREDGTPYYVGKGKPRRPYDKGGRACPTPPKDRIIVLHEGLDEESAFRIEKELIARYGRKDNGTGILRNLSDGGEGPSGVIPSKEIIAKRTQKLPRGQNHHAYTKHDWYHSSHGEFLQLSETDLINLFPEQNLQQGNLSHVVLGRRRTHKGWMLLKSRGVVHKHHGHIFRDWWHPIHGEVKGVSASELIRMYPEQNLGSGELIATVKGRQNHCKGWRLLENKGKQVRNKRNKPTDWYHEKYGVVRDKSATELARLFPIQKLSRGHLNGVLRGKRNSHKGWTTLNPESVESSKEVK